MKNLKTFLAVIIAVVLASCGNTKEEEEEKFTISDRDTEEKIDTSVEETSGGDEGDAEGEVVEIKLEGNDQMQFDKNELKVKAGQTVKLTLEHVGEMPENAMGHNFVLLQKETDITDFAQRAAQAGDNDYIPKNSEEIIANTKMIGGGESTTIEFEAPEAGTYTFICSFPGHYVQMQGEFIVE